VFIGNLHSILFLVWPSDDALVPSEYPFELRDGNTARYYLAGRELKHGPLVVGNECQLSATGGCHGNPL